MKKYNYTGSSILTFSFHGTDYAVFGKGPHTLPSESEFVQSLIGQAILIELEVKQKISKQL